MQVIHIPKLTQIHIKTMHTVAATSIYIKQIHPLKKNCTIQCSVVSVTIYSLNKFSLSV